MATIIVVTDFSESAQNALKYACAFSAASNSIELLLLNISQVPVSYSADGVSMAAISDTLTTRVERLKEELQWVAEHAAGIKIKSRAVIGNFIKSLKELIEEEKAAMLIMGTPASYGEVWSWNTDTLGALTSLPIPVLTVPGGAVYKPITRIAFAAIPGILHSSSPIESLRNLIRYTGAKLHVVTVVPPQVDETKAKQAEAALQLQLEGLDTVYHTIADSHIVQAIGRFVEDQQIDLLVVRPRQHGIWYNLFHKSYARELANLNLIPVMALHDEWNVNA